MKMSHFSFISFIVPVLFLASLAIGEDNLSDLNGTWEGEVNELSVFNINLSGEKKDWPSGNHRLVIDGDKVSVYKHADGKWSEFMPGKFKISHNGPNAVIYGTDSGEDKDGVWVETQVFTVTKKDSDGLLFIFSRSVNNTQLPLDVKHSKFLVTGAGEMKKQK